jgi:hypothetical protein
MAMKWNSILVTGSSSLLAGGIASKESDTESPHRYVGSKPSPGPLHLCYELWKRNKRAVQLATG